MDPRRTRSATQWWPYKSTYLGSGHPTAPTTSPKGAEQTMRSMLGVLTREPSLTMPGNGHTSATAPASTPALGGTDIPSRDLLTPRQREVATLIACGLTNRQIAHELVLSELTVDVHVRNIMARLRVHSRTRIAIWAAEQGLLRSVDD